jgi:hypothetical protein
VRGLERRGHVLRILEPDEAQVHGLGPVRGPGKRERAVGPRRVLGEDRAPDRLAHAELVGLGAGDRDRFLERLDRGLAVGRAVARVRVVDPFDLGPIDEVAVAVGERPRDVAVAACDERRHAGQRRAGEVDVREFDARAEPDVRHAQAEVHVARDERRAIRRERAVDREVVAARRELGAHLGHRMKQFRIELAQIDLLGRRQRRVGVRRANDRRVPLGAVRGEQRIQLGRHRIGESAEVELALAAGVDEVEKHRVEHEHAVGFAPCARRLAQQQVRERAAPPDRRAPR